MLVQGAEWGIGTPGETAGNGGQYHMEGMEGSGTSSFIKGPIRGPSSVLKARVVVVDVKVGWALGHAQGALIRASYGAMTRGREQIQAEYDPRICTEYAQYDPRVYVAQADAQYRAWAQVRARELEVGRGAEWEAKGGEVTGFWGRYRYADAQKEDRA